MRWWMVQVPTRAVVLVDVRGPGSEGIAAKVAKTMLYQGRQGPRLPGTQLWEAVETFDARVNATLNPKPQTLRPEP